MNTLKTEPFKIIIDGVRYNCTLDKDDPAPGQFKQNWPTDWRTIDKSTFINWTKSPLLLHKNDYRRHESITRCIIIARLINGDWVPDWSDGYKPKYHPTLLGGNIECETKFRGSDKDYSFIWFYSEKSCRHFIDHFGEIWLEAIG